MDEKTEKFLQELKDKGLYRDDYDYSKVVYKNCDTNITINDENNHEHIITPYSFLSGSKLSFDISLYQYTKIVKNI